MKPLFQHEGHITPERSAMMARIGPKDTAPELAVRRALHRMGYRFRLHRRDLPGTPDVVLPGLRVALLVHGCFWHRHSQCPFAYTPKNRADFWKAKFARTVIRDSEVQKSLISLGWKVGVVWECDTRDPAALEKILSTLLEKSKTAAR
jgi:DNA mismatch endonuclease (patch repair protein)